MQSSVLPESSFIIVFSSLSTQVFRISFIMSNSSSSTSSTFADIVKSDKNEASSPIRSTQVRANVNAATPSVKRKRPDVESISPISSDSEVQRKCDEVSANQYHKYSVRKRKSNTVKINRRTRAAATVPNTADGSTQTEEELLIQKYINEVEHQRDLYYDLSFKFQVEKEKSSVLTKSLNRIQIRAVLALENVKNNDGTLKSIQKDSIKPDLGSSSAIKSYHDSITHGVKIRSQNLFELTSSVQNINLECTSTFADIKVRNKEANKKTMPWCPKTNACKTISQSSSENSTSLNKGGVQSQEFRLSKRVPFNPEVKFLKAPKSVKFSVPLEEFLSQVTYSPDSKLQCASPDKIEITIPDSNQVLNSSQSRSNAPDTWEQIHANIEKFRKMPVDELDWSLLDVSSNSTIIQNNFETQQLKKKSAALVSEIDQLEKEWNDFAASRIDLSRVNTKNGEDLFDYERIVCPQGVRISPSAAENVFESVLPDSENKLVSSDENTSDVDD